jgi:hypothetical protein
LAIEITDWIAIGISMGSLGFSSYAFYYSTKKQEKAQLNADEEDFMYERLNSDKMVVDRGILYRYYSLNRDYDQTFPKDVRYTEYTDTARVLEERYSIIYDALIRHQNFEKLLRRENWISIIKCDLAMPQGQYKSDRFRNLVNLAIEHLKKENVRIEDINPMQ